MHLHKAITNNTPAAEKSLSHYISITWASYCVKSPSRRPFVQQFIQFNLKGNIKDRSYYTFVRETTSEGCWPVIPLHKWASYEEIGPVMTASCSLWCCYFKSSIYSVALRIRSKLLSFWTAYINISRFPYQNSITMGYKLKLLLLQWIESIHDIKKIKLVRTDTWNYSSKWRFELVLFVVYDNISSITWKLSHRGIWIL